MTTESLPPEPAGFTGELVVVADGCVTHAGGIVCDETCPLHGEGAGK